MKTCPYCEKHCDIDYFLEKSKQLSLFPEITQKDRGSGIYGYFYKNRLIYIGLASSFYSRVRSHYIAKEQLYKRGPLIFNGIDGFIFSHYNEPFVWRILEECPKEKLQEKETFWINEYYPLLLNCQKSPCNTRYNQQKIKIGSK